MLPWEVLPSMGNLVKLGSGMESGVSSSVVLSDTFVATAIPLRLSKPKTTAKSEGLLNDDFTKFRAIKKLKRYKERILSYPWINNGSKAFPQTGSEPKPKTHEDKQLI